jgi:poly(3-hydroxybutyrate) depolymerase
MSRNPFMQTTRIVLLCTTLIPGTLFASNKGLSRVNQSFDDLIVQPQPVSDASTLIKLSKELWAKYRAQVEIDPERLAELEERQLTYQDKSMQFSLSVKGDEPEAGYPLYIALHGGGGTASSINDGQWEHMKTYYLDSVDQGIYVAPRGVTDTWNLHFVNESYSLYDRLIENLIALHHINPNKVYLLGFSAGGDGVYQIVPRMPDRWAAANMSAGHHNWIAFDNLANTPFLLQMGQRDGAYNRNEVAVENHIALDRLQELKGGYVHDLFFHHQGSHNSWRDNDPSGTPAPIVANPKDWLNGEPATVTETDTNAIHWLNKYKRNPYPTKLYWDPGTNAPRTVSPGQAYLAEATNQAQLSQPKELFYWLDVGVAESNPDTGLLQASYDKEQRHIHLKGLADWQRLRVLLHQDMFDFEDPTDITLYVNDNLIGTVQPQGDLQVMTRTLLERGDPSFMFHDELVLARGDDGQWQMMD